MRIVPLCLLYRYVAGERPLVLISDWSLVREPTRALRHQQVAQWCGTVLAGAPQ